MKKKSFLKRIVLSSVKKEVQEEIDNKVSKEKGKWAESTAKEIAKSKDSLGRATSYVSSATGEKFTASQVSPGKSWNIMYSIFSEAPGSTQCADRIRSAITGAGYLLQPVPGGKKDKEELKKLIEFFDNPNEDDTIEEIVQNIVTNYYAFGNSYLEKVYAEDKDEDGKGEVIGIYNLSSEDMKILVDVDKRKAGVNVPIGYELFVPFAHGATRSQKTIIYELDEVMHFKRPDTRSSIYGRAIFEDNQSVIQLILQALAYNIKTFENSGKPPLKIRLPEGTSSTEAIEFSNFFEKNFQGTANAGKALILYNNADAGALGLTPSDMDYLNLLGFGLKQVGGMYGVPMIMISQPEGSNRATSFEETKSFYQRVVQPLRNYICNTITKSIIQNSFGFKDWRLDFQDIDLEDSKSRVEEASKSFMYGTRSWNEARKRMGLESGSEPWQDDFYVVHNGIATPLRDFASGKAQEDRAKAKDGKKEEKEEKKSTVEKTETISKAKKTAKEENDLLNKGEVIQAERSHLHKTHIEEHKKVLYTIKEKHRASLRVHIYSHEDLMWEQDKDGNYGRVTSGDKKKKTKK